MLRRGKTNWRNKRNLHTLSAANLINLKCAKFNLSPVTPPCSCPRLMAVALYLLLNSLMRIGYAGIVKHRSQSTRPETGKTTEYLGHICKGDKPFLDLFQVEGNNMSVSLYRVLRPPLCYLYYPTQSYYFVAFYGICGNCTKNGRQKISFGAIWYSLLGVFIQSYGLVHCQSFLLPMFYMCSDYYLRFPSVNGVLCVKRPHGHPIMSVLFEKTTPPIHYTRIR